MGMVADWDFFLKCQLSGLKMLRTYKTNFYHFTSASTNGDKRAIAEQEGHHPDIHFGWGYTKIEIYTHAINGLAESDFILAAKIDQI